MKKQYDLVYYNDGLFTMFLPETKEGEQAWNELAAQTEGTGKVLYKHADDVKKALRKAGYLVGRGKREQGKDLDDILLDSLLG